MQPKAGPWLSPNVVTVNSLPMGVAGHLYSSFVYESCSAVSRKTPPPPRSKSSHMKGSWRKARRTAVSVFPTSTTSSPCGRKCRPASCRMTRTESSPARPAASAIRGS